MAIERDEDLEREAEADPVRAAIGELFVAIIENTKDGSRARKRAMTEALEAHGRIMDAMRDSGPTIN
jgi:hypothetical protein